MPVDHAAGIDPNLVGHTGQIVSALQILVAIGHNPLAALLEIDQSLAQRLYRGWRIGTEHARFDVDTFDLVAFLGFANGIEDFIQTQGRASAVHERTDHVAIASFFHDTVKVEHQDTIVGYICGGAGGSHHAHNTHYSNNAHNQREHNNANYSGKHIFKKIFHVYTCFDVLFPFSSAKVSKILHIRMQYVQKNEKRLLNSYFFINFVPTKCILAFY